MESGPKRKNKGVEIPDDDMLGWMRMLREGGFSDAEIDRILSGLNAEYFRVKMTEDMRKGFEHTLAKKERVKGRRLKPEEVKVLLESYRSSFQK